MSKARTKATSERTRTRATARPKAGRTPSKGKKPPTPTAAERIKAIAAELPDEPPRVYNVLLSAANDDGERCSENLIEVGIALDDQAAVKLAEAIAAAVRRYDPRGATNRRRPLRGNRH